jgi:thioesterase domain-containing protein
MPTLLSTVADIERDLYAQIPLARAMQVHVDAADQEAVRLSAPYSPNRNPHHTVFGGSSAALALMAGWTLLTLRLRDASLAAHIVIQRSRISYEAPIRDTFRACCTAPSGRINVLLF